MKRDPIALILPMAMLSRLCRWIFPHRAAIVLLGLVAGCASLNARSASPSGLAAADLKGKSVAAVSWAKPDFTAMTAGSAMVGASFGIIGALAEQEHMATVGNRIVQENEIEDPAIYINQRIMEDLTTRLGLIAKDVKGGVTKSGKIPDLRQQYGDVDVLLDVRTNRWGFGYFPTDWDHYDAVYVVSLRLIDMKTGRNLAVAKAKYVPWKKRGNAPTKDQLLSNKAERLKQAMRAAADSCLVKLRASILPREFNAAPVSPTLATAETANPDGATESIGYFDAIRSDPPPVVGQQYYTRHCFKYEKGVWPTTNYWQGTLVPINTQVTVVSLGDKSMELRLMSGETVKIVNVEKYSKRSMTDIARNLLTPEAVPVDKFDEATVNAIKGGTLILGMTKEQVVMAHGYPPGHKTPSLDADTWLYWNGRSDVRTILFKGGVLSEDQGVPPPANRRRARATASSAETATPDAESNSTPPAALQEPSAPPAAAAPPPTQPDAVAGSPREEKGTGKVRTPDRRVISLPPATTEERKAPDAVATAGTKEDSTPVARAETPGTTAATNPASVQTPDLQSKPVIWLSSDRVVSGMPLHLRVLSGAYSLKQGTTFMAGSDTNIDESWMTFPEGLSVEVGEPGVIIKNQPLPTGSKWVVDTAGKLAPEEIPVPGSGATATGADQRQIGPFRVQIKEVANRDYKTIGEGHAGPGATSSSGSMNAGGNSWSTGVVTGWGISLEFVGESPPSKLVIPISRLLVIDKDGKSHALSKDKIIGICKGVFLEKAKYVSNEWDDSGPAIVEVWSDGNQQLLCKVRTAPQNTSYKIYGDRTNQPYLTINDLQNGDIEIEMLGGRPFDLTLVCDERDIVPAELVWPGAGTFHLSQATSR